MIPFYIMLAVIAIARGAGAMQIRGRLATPLTLRLLWMALLWWSASG